MLGIVEKIKEGRDEPLYDPATLIVDYEAKNEDVYSNTVKATVDATGRLDISGSGLCINSRLIELGLRIGLQLDRVASLSTPTRCTALLH